MKHIISQKTFKLRNWKYINTSEENHYNNRKLAKVVIGERTYSDGTIEPITEDIYEDILREVHVLKQPEYKVMCDINHYPIITILYNGILTLHNPHIRQDKEDIEAAFNAIDKTLLLNAYSEMRLNMECLSKIGKATNLLISTVNMNTNKDYSYPFIQAVLHKVINDDINVPADEVAVNVMDFSYEELLQCVCGIVEFKATKKCTIEPIKTILESGMASFERAEKVVEQELIYRVASGQLKGE